MTPLAELLRDRIRREGPISFHDFMEASLYHPSFGYYRRDRFGKEGDFYTAEQLQPVFGVLIAAEIRRCFEQMGRPAGFTVVELGSGRGELAPVLAEWRYVPVDLTSPNMPDRFCGVVFSNEFFDALPVHAVTFQEGRFLEMNVTFREDRFVWLSGEVVSAEVEDYLRRYFPPPEPGRWYEVNREGLRMLERVAGVLECGQVITVDYGYTRSEWLRFAAGSLMSYRRHTAYDDVLIDPGERDITAHVNFTALAEHGAGLGLRAAPLQTLAQFLLRAGEADQFAAALAGTTAQEQTQRRLQLKTLLFGMGETFRVLMQEKEQRGQK